VYIEPEEIKKITPESGRTMEILAFLDEAEVDPIYFDSSFWRCLMRRRTSRMCCC